jgi:hypothetical protein
LAVALEACAGIVADAFQGFASFTVGRARAEAVRADFALDIVEPRDRLEVVLIAAFREMARPR